jgi:hypothetical protein
MVGEVLRSPGRPLDPAAQTFFGARFGHDFGRVRVYNDARAAASARAVGARAYTVGNAVVFTEGAYAPGTPAGDGLLAHELTHVVQQAQAPALLRQVGADGRADVAVEEAEDAATQTSDEESAVASPDPIAPYPLTGSPSHGRPSDGPTADGPTTASTASPLGERYQILPPDHPLEREADAVSRSVMSGATPIPILSRLADAGVFLQRQIYWEDRSTLTWADFTANPPEGSAFDASTWSGMVFPAVNPEPEAHPSPADAPAPCTVGKKATTEFGARVALNPSKINVRAVMKPSQSWVKPGKKDATLLQHEQGHFDISNVIAEKTEAAAVTWATSNVGSATKCGKTAALNAAIKAWNALKAGTEIPAIWATGETVRTTAQNDYDDQTKHGLDAAQQSAWKKEIAAGLPKYTL